MGKAAFNCAHVADELLLSHFWIAGSCTVNASESSEAGAPAS